MRTTPEPKDKLDTMTMQEQTPVGVLKFMMTASTGFALSPVAPPLMALALNPGLPRATQLDQKSIQVWTLYAREGRMRNDRAGPFFAHTNDALARSSKSLATPRPQLRTKS